MYPATIEDYRRPKTLADALADRNGYGDDGHFIAGGQSLMQAIKARLVQPVCLVDLQDVSELKGVSVNGGARVGAMTRYVELAEDERLGPAHAALRDAAQHVGDRQVRNRGTIGGSLCWNYVAACMPAVALGLGANLVLVRHDGTKRSLTADEFLGSPLETAREADEILEAVELAAPEGPAGSAYKKWALVHDGLPVVGVCVSVTMDDGQIGQARIAFGGLASGPKRSPKAERELVGCGRDDVKGIERAMEAAAAELETQGDFWADPEYRKQLVRTLGREVAETAIARAAG